jgi:hypothetical protein
VRLEAIDREQGEIGKVDHRKIRPLPRGQAADRQLGYPAAFDRGGGCVAARGVRRSVCGAWVEHVHVSEGGQALIGNVSSER